MYTPPPRGAINQQQPQQQRQMGRSTPIMPPPAAVQLPGPISTPWLQQQQQQHTPPQFGVQPMTPQQQAQYQQQYQQMQQQQQPPLNWSGRTSVPTSTITTTPTHNANNIYPPPNLQQSGVMAPNVVKYPPMPPPPVVQQQIRTSFTGPPFQGSFPPQPQPQPPPTANWNPSPIANPGPMGSVPMNQQYVSGYPVVMPAPTSTSTSTSTSTFTSTPTPTPDNKDRGSRSPSPRPQSPVPAPAPQTVTPILQRRPATPPSAALARTKASEVTKLIEQLSVFMGQHNWTTREMSYTASTMTAIDNFLSLLKDSSVELPVMVEYVNNISKSLQSSLEKLSLRRVSEIFPFLTAVVLSLLVVVEKLPDKPEVKKTLEKVFSVVHSAAIKVSSRDDISKKEEAIFYSLKKYDQTVVFVKLGDLLEQHLSIKAHPFQAYFEITLCLLYMAFHSFVKDETSDRVIENWKSAIMLIMAQPPFNTIREIFLYPMALCSTISLSSPVISMSVLRGLLGTVQNMSSSHLSEEQMSQVPELVYWICPAKFKVPLDDDRVIKELSELLSAFLDLSCPLNAVAVPTLAKWWYWMYWIAEEVSNEASNKLCLTKPFSERSIQYNIHSLLPELAKKGNHTTKFFNESFRHYIKTTTIPVQYAIHIPPLFMDLSSLSALLEQQFSTLPILEAAKLFEQYASLLPVHPPFMLLFKPLEIACTHESRFMDTLFLPLHCTEYSKLFDAHDEAQFIFAKDHLFVKLGVLPSFYDITSNLMKRESTEKVDNQLYQLFLRSLASTMIKNEAPPENPISTQLKLLGKWFGNEIAKIPEAQNTTFICAVLMECMRTRLEITPDDVLHLSADILPLFTEIANNHHFTINYMQYKQKILEKMKIPLEEISGRHINKLTLDHLCALRPHETSRYIQLCSIASKLFSIRLPVETELCNSFSACKQELELLSLIRVWLLQNARVQLKPITSELNLDSGFIDDLESIVNQFRRHFPGLKSQHLDMLKFFVPKSNIFFEQLMKNKIEKYHSELELNHISEILAKVWVTMEKLLTGDLLFSKAKKFFGSHQSNDTTVTEVLEFFRGQGSDHQNTCIFVTHGLTLLEYLDHTGSITNCCKQYKLCSRSAEGLSGMVNNLGHQAITLRNCSGVLEGLKEEIFHLSAEHLSFFDTISIAGDVLDWLKNFDDLQFQQKSELVRSTTHGWKFGQDLQRCVENAYGALQFFNQMCSRPDAENLDLSKLCQELKVKVFDKIGSIKDLIFNIRAVLENLPQIKLMYSGTALNIDALLPYITKLRQDGQYRSCLSLHPSGESLCMLVCEKDREQELSHSFLMNLLRAAKIFISSADERDYTTVVEFVQIFTWVEEMHTMRLKLEAKGHPMFQGISTLLNKPGEIVKVDLFSNMHSQVKQTIQQWKSAVKAAYQEEPRLNFLTAKQLSAFGKLFSEVGFMPSVEEHQLAMIGAYIQTCFPETASKNKQIPLDSVKQCIQASAAAAAALVAQSAAGAPPVAGAGGEKTPPPKEKCWDAISMLTLAKTCISQFGSTITKGASTLARAGAKPSALATEEGAQDMSIILAEHFTPSSLMYLLFEVFGNKPFHPSLVLNGKDATKSDVKRLIKCVSTFTHLCFAFVGVNEMAEELRSLLYQWSIAIAQQENPQIARVSLIFTSKVGIDVFFSWETKQPEAVVERVRAKLVEDGLTADKLLGDGTTVRLYTAGPRCGKSTEITHAMKLEQANNPDAQSCNCTFSVTEGWSVSSVISKLSSMLPTLVTATAVPTESTATATDVAATTTESATTATATASSATVQIHLDVSAYADFHALSLFLYDLLLWRIIQDRRTGCIYPLHTNNNSGKSNCKWVFFVELATSPASDAQAGFGFHTMEGVLQNIPILSHLHQQQQIPQSSPPLPIAAPLEIIADDNAKIVAIFLHAKEGGAMKDHSEFVQSLRRLVEQADGGGGGDSAVAVTPEMTVRLLSEFRQAHPALQEMQKFHHCVALLAERCRWMSQFAAQRAKEPSVEEGLVSLSDLFAMFVAESVKLCQLSLDCENLVFIARQKNLHHVTKPCVFRFSSGANNAKADAPELPAGLTLVDHNDQAQLVNKLSEVFGVKDLGELLTQQNYILTPDFALKLLLIHDHYKSGQNLTLCGGTGVGKTELLNIFSVIINASADIVPNMNRRVRHLIVQSLEAIPSTPEIEDCLQMLRSSVGSLTSTALEELVEQICHFPSPQGNRHPNLFPLWASQVVSRIKRQLEIIKIIQSTKLMRRALDSSFTQPAEFHFEEKDAYVVSNAKELSRLVVEVREAKFDSIFTRIKMHQHISVDQFRDKISKAQQMVQKLPASGRMVCFIDECTSTSLLGMVKDVLCDSRLDGEPISPQLFFVAALNKNELESTGSPDQPQAAAVEAEVTAVPSQRQQSSKREFDFVGVPSGLEKAFAVRPPPLSLEHFIVDFGKLSDHQQENFIHGIIMSRIEGAAGTHKEITSLILMSQKFVNKAHIHRVTASIRDIVRTVSLYNYFMKHSFFLWQKGLPEQELYRADPNYEKKMRSLNWHKHWQSLALSVALSYYFRLPSSDFINHVLPNSLRDVNHGAGTDSVVEASTPWSREQYVESLRSYLQSDAFADVPEYILQLEDFVSSVLKQLCSNTQLPVGIAKTNAFLENLFCTVVCMDAMIPLVIVGPPGCSKTLSFKIAIDNMKGDTSMSPFYQKLHHILPFRYQCSERSTDMEIKDVYNSAIERQKTFPENSNQICTVLLDEVGLPDENQSPLKSLHYKLDHPKVSSILLSNRILDEAKTNRTLMLLQSEPPPDDLVTLAQGCIFDNDTEISGLCKEFLRALCVAYQDATLMKFGSKYPSRFFHLRDFVYFLRFLRKHSVMQRATGSPIFQMSREVVLHGLKRNFGGLEKAQFSKLVEMFFDRINVALARFRELLWNASTLDERGAVVQSTDIPMIRESLAERLLDSDDPNTAPFRYIMLLDPTENEAAVSLLFDLKLCDRATTSVCYVGDFADDRDQRVKAAIIEKVKTAMERGETVLLVNSTSIHSSFYDVFNRHYTVIPRSQADISKDPTKNPSTRCCYANIAAGSFSQPCLVHNDFRLIVHVPKSMLRSIPAPLLNRFEKYTLGVDDALQDHFSRFRLDPLQVEGAQMHPFEVLKNAAMHMVQELHVKSSNSLLFYGLHAQETVSSLILTVAEYTQTKAVEARRSKTKTVEVRPDGNPQGEANIGHHEEGPSQQSQPQDEEAQNTFNCNAVIPQFPPVLSASTLSENSNSTSASSNAANTTTSTVATAGTEPHSEATKTAGTDNVFAEPSHWETNIREYIRKINFHLLKLGRPESMYLCKRIPKIYLREYLLSQEHFSIYRFLEQLCKASASNSDDPTKTAVMSQYASKWCVFTRTSAELLKLPHDEQFHSVICNSIGVASGKGGGRTAKECLQVFSLSEISCSQQCSDLVSAFCSSETHQLLICLADLTVVTSHQINFVRNEINECWKRLTRPRIALVLLHYSPETGIRSESSYHAIFRNGWDFMYIDSLGIAPGNAKIKAHPEANPSLWISQAYNIHTHGGGKPQKLDESNEAVAFREPFFDLLQQFCAFMGGSLLGAAGLKDESLTFYSRPTFAKGPVIAGSIRFKILQAALTQHPLLYEGLLEQLSRSWTPEFLRKLVHDASVELYRGSCVQSFVSIFSNSFNHFLIPLIQTWLKMMLSSYGLQPVLSIFTSHEESVSSKLMELVHLVYKTIAVPQLDNKLLSKQLVPTVTISRVFETPSELPFFDPISNVLQVYVSKAASLLRNSKLTFDVLEEKVIEIIKENRALNNVVEHINSNQQLFSMFKQDFLLRTMKQTNLSFPKFSEATQNKDPEAWCNFVHILIDMMCHLSGGTRCRVTSLFVAKRFHADDINYFRMLLYPLQNLKPSLEGPELQLLRNIPRNMHSSSADLHEAHMKMGSWVTEQITIILWDRLMALLQPSKFSRDMFINWGQAYRRFYTHLKPRNELAILLSNSYPTLLKIDAMRVLFLFVLNIDPQQFESSLRFLQYNPNIASVMEQHSKSQYLPGNRLIQGLLLAINFLPPLADQATPLEEHSFRAVTEYYLMDPTQTVGISTDSEENLKAFLMICRGTFQHSNAALVEYCKKMSTNFGWWMNVLNSWILSKPYQWIVDSYQIISALIAEYKTVNKPFKYSFRPDLLCPTPGESATSLEYALFHILLAAMCGRKEEKEDPHLEGNTETRNNGTAGQSNNQDARLKDPHHKDTVSEKDPNHETGRQKQFSFPFYQLQDALAFYQSIPLNFENGAEAVFAVMQKAASGSTLLRLAAAGLGGENGIQDQVKAIASVVKEIFDSPSAPIRCKEYFLNHIHSEETLLTLLKCLPALQQLNLTDFHTSGSVELEKVYHFPFMLPRNSPEYRGQRATLLSNPDFNSTTFLDLERIFGLVTSGAQAGTAELIRVLKNELSIPETQQIRIYEIKMCLVLVAYYQYFVNKTPCNAILSALSELKGTLSLSDKEILALDFLSTGPKDIPDMENSILYSFSRQSYESKVDQTLEHTVANLMVNILAITIALPVTNHMHMRMFKIEACDGTLCPGSGYHRKNKDCGFQMYKGKLHDLAADPPIMRNSAPHRFALNTITWCSFCWALILDPQGHMKAKNYRDTFLNCLEDVKNTNLAHKIHGYIHNRALGFFLELENDGEFRQQHIDASHFITEALLLIWQHMHANPNDPCLPQGGIYRDADKPKVVEYENMIQKVFDVIQAKYDLLKSAFLKAREDTSPFKTIVTLRSEQAKMLPSLIVSWDLFSELVAKTSASELLRTFIDVRPKLRAVSKIPELVHYYKFLNEAFSPFLLEDDVNLPMPDCIQKVMTTNAELANTMKAEFQKFLSAWDVIHDAIGEIEGCPLQMAERRFEASVPVVDVTTPFSEFVSFQDTGRGDMIYRMIHTLCHEIQNKLLAGYNKTWTAPGINPCEFVCDNTVASNNVEFIPYQTETALLVTGESSPRELEFALSNCMQISNDGSRANVTVDDIQLHRHITSRYLTGRCFLIDDNLRQVFVFLHPEEQQQQQQPATNEEAQDQKSSKSDQQELQLDQAVARLPAANFSDQIPSYQRPKLEVALNAQTEEQIRELMQNCTLLLQGLHREIRNNPTEPHHEQNFSLCWQKFLPSKAIPEPFHTLKSQRVSVIGTLSSIVLDKFKTKQWLFSGIGTRFESAPAASLQQELDSKIKKITTEASFGEVKKLYAVVSAICRVFTREHVTVHPPLTPLRNLFGEAESLPEGITKLEVDDFLSDFKVQHYCFFMRKVHTLCGDLLVELSAREVEGDCYQEPVPNIKLAKGQSEFEEGTPPHTGEENSGIVICPLVTAPEGDVVLTQATSIPHSDIESTKQEADKIVKHVKEIADISKLTSLVGRINDHLTSVHQQEIPEGGESIRIRRMVAESVGRITSNLKDLSCDTTVITGKLNQIVTVSDEINQKIQSAQETEAAAALNELKNVEQTATEWLLKLDEMCAKMEVLEREASDLKLNPLPQPTETVTAASPPNLNELPPPLLPEKPPANRPATPPKQPGVFQPPSLHPPLASVTSTPGPQPYQPPPPQHYQPQPPPQPNMSRHPLPPLPQATPTTTLPSQGSPLPPPGMPTRPPPNPQLYSSQPSSPPPANLPPPPHNIPPVSYSIGPQQFMNSPPLYHHPSPTPAFVPSVPPTQYRYTNPPIMNHPQPQPQPPQQQPQPPYAQHPPITSLPPNMPLPPLYHTPNNFIPQTGPLPPLNPTGRVMPLPPANYNNQPMPMMPIPFPGQPHPPVSQPNIVSLPTHNTPVMPPPPPFNRRP